MFHLICPDGALAMYDLGSELLKLDHLWHVDPNCVGKSGKIFDLCLSSWFFFCVLYLFSLS